jgi:hypothetical protein
MIIQILAIEDRCTIQFGDGSLSLFIRDLRRVGLHVDLCAQKRSADTDGF